MAEVPEELQRRSAEARAAADGVSVDEVLARWRGEAPAAAPPPAEALEAAAPADVPAAPAPAAPAAAPAMSVEEYAKAAAEAAGMPEKLLMRSATAKAAKQGVSVEAVLAEMAGLPAPGTAPAPPPAVAEAPTPAAAAAPAAPAAASTMSTEEYAKAAAAASGMPEKLLMRSANAKAKAQGVAVEAVLAEMAGLPAPGTAPAAAPDAAPAAAAAVVPAAASAMSVEEYAKAAAAAAGMPEKLLMRSANAKAKAQGVAVEAVLAEMAGLPPPGAAPALAPTGTNGTAAVAAAPAPAPAAVPSGPPEGVRTQRLLTVVQARAIQQVKAEPTDKVNVWPHLLAIEFVALLVVTAVLIVISVIINAPLLEAANFNLTPNPSKAPWYFLGLQELLSYFDPMIAGVLIPGLIGLVGLMAIPYIDRNPSVRPADRKLAIMMFTFFLMGAATLVIIGSFFRGPGFNFTYPWSDGVFFDDLKDWLE
jgi:hypothetical protein